MKWGHTRRSIAVSKLNMLAIINYSSYHGSCLLDRAPNTSFISFLVTEPNGRELHLPLLFKRTITSLSIQANTIVNGDVLIPFVNRGRFSAQFNNISVYHLAANMAIVSCAVHDAFIMHRIPLCVR